MQSVRWAHEKNQGFNMKTLILVIILILVECTSSNSQIIVTLNGDTTKVWDKDFEMECCAKFEIASRIANDTIWITEIDTIEPCRCNCIYTNCISFIALPIGTYHALLYRQIKFFGDPPSYAGSLAFTISSPPILSPGIMYYQSGCHTVPNNVAENPLIPQKYATLTNYPNPFNPGTIIRFSIPNTVHVTLAIFNLSGQLVSILIDEFKRAGTYEFNYNSHNGASGVYICRLRYGGQVLSSKITLIK